jgi:hypothetical protein
MATWSIWQRFTLVRRDQRVVAYEVKLGATVDDHDVRHLKWLANPLGDQLLDAIVITTGPAAYRRKDGIGVVPASLLGLSVASVYWVATSPSFANRSKRKDLVSVAVT